MNTLILSVFCALALNSAAAGPAASDTTDFYIIDNRKIENFDGTQLVGKKIVSYEIKLTAGKHGKSVYRMHEIHTSDEQTLNISEIRRMADSIKVSFDGGKAISDLSGQKGERPLLIVDGKETDMGTGLPKPEEISSVIVYNPGSREAVQYGDKGRNGVMEIMTVKAVRERLEKQERIIIIDGKKSTQEALSALDPDNIVSVSVYKDSSAVAKFTDRPSAGVIVIMTAGGK